MQPIREFVAELARLDIRLWVDGGKLCCSAPRHVLTPQLQRQLADRRAELHAFLDTSRIAQPDAGAALAQRPERGNAPLSFGQERIRALTDLQPGSAAYNISTVFRLRGALDEAALEKSLSELQRRHEILRTTFAVVNGEPRQRIHPPTAFALTSVDAGTDLRDLPPDVGAREVERLLQAEARRPFDVGNTPPWRARLLRLGERDCLLSLTMHHLIFDGASKPVFLRELETLYAAYAAGHHPRLPEPRAQYGDYAHWQRGASHGDELQRQLAYWSRKLAGSVPALHTPIDHPRQRAGTTSASGSYAFALSGALTAALAEASRAARVGPFVTLLGVFYALLHRYTGQEDLIVCSPYACRDRPELEAMIGYCNNIVAMRATLAGDPSLRELIDRVRLVAREAHENQNAPLQRLTQFANLARVPLNRAMFTFQDTSNRTLNLPGIEATPVSVRKAEPDFELAMYIENSGPQWAGVLEYNADLFERNTIARLVSDFRALLERYADDPDVRLSELPDLGRTPADVESLLAGHSGIDRVAVVPAAASGTLTAYLVLNEDATPRLDEIRAYARAALPEYRVPAAFVPLDQLPLTIDGSIDRSALPAPGSPSNRRADTYVAPRTPLERSIAELWKNALWLDHDVGVHDDFQDLGGHSLLAVQLLTELESRLQRKVPMHALARLTTVAALAELLEQDGRPPAADARAAPGAVRSRQPRSNLAPEIYRGLRGYVAAWQGHRAAPDSLIVGHNTGGRRQALFWCLQRQQELLQLARYLGPDQPVFGMRSGNRVMEKSQENIDALAAHYVAEIVELQPAGPILVGGNCQAARIAFQIAAQLERRGRAITLLFLMEKFIPQPYACPVALLFGAESDRNPYLYFRRPELGWAKYYSGPFTVDMIRGGHGQFFLEPNIQVLAATIQRRIEQARSTPAPAPRQASIARQTLPESAYRAKLTASAPPPARAAQKVSIPVEVHNLSPVTWRATDRSGIFVANRWLSPEGRVVMHSDGRAELTHDLAPGASLSRELAITTPSVAGRYMLELDLVDEGIAWFRSQGSTATYCPVEVG